MKKIAFLLALLLLTGALAACDAAPEQGNSGLVADSSSSIGDDSSESGSSRSIPGSRSASSSSSSSSGVGTSPGASSQSRNGGQASGSANPATTPSSGQPATTTPPEAPAPPPAPAPAPTPEPVPEPPAPPPEQPKGAYDYPFDVGQIQNDMIAWGQAAGMTHEPGARSPDNSSWDNPITASEGFQGEILKSKLQEYVQFYTSASWQGYGNEPVAHFTIYVSGTTFYVLH